MTELLADRYELRELLGEGGMGTVHRAYDRTLDEEVALKTLHVALSSDGPAVERFRREVKLARRVTHPNVARTFDVGRHGSIEFLTMELVLGESLARLRGDARPPLAETLRIAEHVARGLAAAHAAGVVHRDLKPENVIRCPGSNGRVVITDFGIARLAEGVPSNDTQLTVNQIIGTPAYMAPEQLFGQTVDGRTDVYAFGTLFFELLTGQIPFHRSSMQESVAARIAIDAPDPRTLDPSIPEPIACLVNETLLRSREDRPDAESLLRRIEQIRGGAPAQVATPAKPLLVRSAVALDG